jgi:hypothetical protein
MNQESQLLRRTIDRLKQDKEEIEELVTIRNKEIEELRQPPDTREFRRMLLEMTTYFDEAESRQERQALILQDIGRMINVDFKDRVERLKQILEVTATEVQVESTRPGGLSEPKNFMITRGVNTNPPPKPRRQPSRAAAEQVKAKSEPVVSIQPFRRAEVADAIAYAVMKLIRKAAKQQLAHTAPIDVPIDDPVDIPPDFLSETGSVFDQVPRSIKSRPFARKRTTPLTKISEQPTREDEVKTNEESLPTIAKYVPTRRQQTPAYRSEVMPESPSEVMPQSHKQILKFDVEVQTSLDWNSTAQELTLPSIDIAKDFIRKAKIKAKTSAVSSSIKAPTKGALYIPRSYDEITEIELPKVVVLTLEPLKVQYPMIETNIYKLMEASMDEKAKLDTLDQEQGRPMRHMMEILLDFLYKQYGLKFLALKNFSSLLEGLQANINHPYIKFFSDFLGVTDTPIKTALGGFVIKARTAFISCQRRAARVIGETGGEASIAELIDCIPKLFSGTELMLRAGEITVQRLMADLPFDELLPALVTNRLSKVGLDYPSFFSKLDSSRQGSIPQEAISEGIRSVIELWIPQQDLMNYFRKSFRSSTVTQSQLTAKLLVPDTSLVLQSKAAIITKCDFLNAIVDSAAEVKSQEVARMQSLFDELETEYLTRDTFAEAARRIIDPQLSEDKLREMFGKFAEASSEQMSSSSWGELVKYYHLGGVVAEDNTEHDHVIDYQHADGHLAVKFQRKNTKYIRKR